jgi:hypothetical protein
MPKSASSSRGGNHESLFVFYLWFGFEEALLAQIIRIAHLKKRKSQNCQNSYKAREECI